MTRQQTTLPSPPPQPCYLNRCDPRSRLATFFIMLFVFTHANRGAVQWWLAFMAVILLPWLAKMGWKAFLQPLWKLRFFFITLLILHGFFIPGSALLPFSQWPSQEGLVVGGQQSIRLALMASLSWVLVKVSSTEDLVSGLCSLLSPLKHAGIPVQQWTALLGWTLNCVGRLATIATLAHDRVLPEGGKHGLWDAMALLGQRAHFFLIDMMDDMAKQEEALSTQGIPTGLPLPKATPFRPGWRDRVLIAYSLLLLFVPFIHTMFQ